jgi:hypothetical protein
MAIRAAAWFPPNNQIPREDERRPSKATIGDNQKSDGRRDSERGSQNARDEGICWKECNV